MWVISSVGRRICAGKVPPKQAVAVQRGVKSQLQSLFFRKLRQPLLTEMTWSILQASGSGITLVQYDSSHAFLSWEVAGGFLASGTCSSASSFRKWLNAALLGTRKNISQAPLASARVTFELAVFVAFRRFGVCSCAAGGVVGLFWFGVWLGGWVSSLFLWAGVSCFFCSLDCALRELALWAPANSSEHSVYLWPCFRKWTCVPDREVAPRYHLSVGRWARARIYVLICCCDIGICVFNFHFFAGLAVPLVGCDNACVIFCWLAVLWVWASCWKLSSRDLPLKACWYLAFLETFMEISMQQWDHANCSRHVGTELFGWVFKKPPHKHEIGCIIDDMVVSNFLETVCLESWSIVTMCLWQQLQCLCLVSRCVRTLVLSWDLSYICSSTLICASTSSHPHIYSDLHLHNLTYVDLLALLSLFLPIFFLNRESLSSQLLTQYLLYKIHQPFNNCTLSIFI